MRTARSPGLVPDRKKQALAHKHQEQPSFPSFRTKDQKKKKKRKKTDRSIFNDMQPAKLVLLGGEQAN